VVEEAEEEEKTHFASKACARASEIEAGVALTVLLKVSAVNPGGIVRHSRGNPQRFCDTPCASLRLL
jgi:hypothetical protein